MQHLPKHALFLGRAVKEHFDCCERPLPEQFNVLLCLLDGAERRQRLQAKLNAGPLMKFDLPADVHWVPADQVVAADREEHNRHFRSLRRAIDFVMHELNIPSRANAWITSAGGSLAIEQIERLQ